MQQVSRYRNEITSESRYALVAGAVSCPIELCSVVRKWRLLDLTKWAELWIRPGIPGGDTPETGGVGILSTGEEEVKVAKSEAPVITGVWCKRETLRSQ